MRRLVLAFLLICATIAIHAQSVLPPEWEEQLEFWAEQNDGIDIDDAAEQIASLCEHPANINDSTQATELFFLTNAQQQSLRAYIRQYGMLLSLNELRLINGYDSVTIQLLRHVAVAEPITHSRKITPSNLAHYGQSTLLLGGHSQLEPSRGYIEDIYEGNPLRLYFKYTYRYDRRIQLQLSADKDPGETLFKGSNPQGFDFYGGHLILNDIWRFKRIIVGQYRLQFGQGLTLWSGMHPWSTTETSTYRNSQNITAASPFAEYGYLQGIATTLRLSNHFELNTFYSTANRSATKADSTSIQSLYQSGYHRTQTEISKEHGINEQLCGFNLQYNTQKIHIGTTSQLIWFNKEIIPAHYAYNAHAFTGMHHCNIGADMAILIKQATLYGELARSADNAYAGIIGLQMPLPRSSAVNIYYRNYSPLYHNFYSSAWGINSTPTNEEGLRLAFSTQLPFTIRMQLSADIFRFPDLKYRVYSPSHGSEYRILLTKNIFSNASFDLSYRYKSCGRNGIQNADKSYIIEQIHRQRLQARFAYRNGDWSLRTNLTHTWFDCEYHDPQKGYSISQDISYTFHSCPLTLIGRFAIFNITDYDAAIYSVESDFQYEYGTTSLNNKGIRAYVLAQYKISPQLALSAKYGITNYPDLETLGTGYATTYSSHRQSIKLQLRCNF